MISSNFSLTCANKNQIIINAFLHPQTTDDAFQLSEKQLKIFADLGIAGGTANSANAETILPFTKEPDARVEPTFATMGEAPLRIYKNEYDKPPAPFYPKRMNCVITADERFDRAMKIIEEKGWDREPRTYPALFQDRPSIRDAYSAGDGAASSSKDGSPSANKQAP